MQMNQSSLYEYHGFGGGVGISDVIVPLCVSVICRRGGSSGGSVLGEGIGGGFIGTL